MWSGSGEQVGVVRAHSSFLAAHRIGPITCLAFAPYDLLLASGGGGKRHAVEALPSGITPTANSVACAAHSAAAQMLLACAPQRAGADASGGAQGRCSPGVAALSAAAAAGGARPGIMRVWPATPAVPA